MASQARMDLKGLGHSVTCLGQTFDSEDERREYFRELLRERLADPEFRAMAGFPHASDDDIIRMSDPPYYTACPNPFLPEFIEAIGEPYNPDEPYFRTPLVVDVSVGKTDPLYKAHGYHTKVPHQAIVPSILHFTKPGAIVLDAFCGSGMTAVAAQFCGRGSAAYRAEVETQFREAGIDKPEWGSRHAIVSDLSPAATFIAANYASALDADAYEAAYQRIIGSFERDLGWMYRTRHKNEACGRIQYTVWSQVFSCPSCSNDIVFTEQALTDSGSVKEHIDCSSCGAKLKKKDLEVLFSQRLDNGEALNSIRRVPAIISYVYGGKVYSKKPDEQDLSVIQRIEELAIWAVPTNLLDLSRMYHGTRLGPKGIKRVHHFYMPRALQALAYLWSASNNECDERIRKMLLFTFEQGVRNLSVLNAYEPNAFSQNARGQKIVYYVPSHHSEVSPDYLFSGKHQTIIKAMRSLNAQTGTQWVSTGSASRLEIPNNSIDYVFTDPPFGENIFYADLNIMAESWHRVFTSSSEEAIVDRFKNKDLLAYQDLMQSCFQEYFRVLKPGRWMTVVFSNSRASVWNAIQVALQQVGFVVAEVTALDKTQGSYRQVTSANAVKQDLIMSCYKPNGGLEDRFEARGLTDDTAWDFLRTHLKNLAVVKRNIAGGVEIVAERDARRLFDRMVAWFVRHNTPVPLSSAEFQAGLAERFPERDGMFFLPNQLDEYDKARMEAGAPPQRDLFVDDERTAIEWLTDFLRSKPSTYQEIHPEFTQKTGAGWRKHETKPELTRLLDENFLKFDGDGPVPSQIHRYLSSNWKELRNLEKDDPNLVGKARYRWFVPDPNKQQDVEARREKALLREFDIYKAHKGRKMKEIRLEVMRVGFKAAWAAKDYHTIIDVTAKVPDEVWQEDERLMMLHSMAETRLEADR